ncbi:hypothetical protein KAU34_05685 [candidate division WOR-3 bacterium]|nr:hypothetical protein [candidate division WOR-3 bacterium]
MIRIGLILSLIVNILFSYGIRRTINLNIHRSVAIGVIGISDTEVTDFGLGMVLPLSRYIGLQTGICGFGYGSDNVYRAIIGGEIGFIEMFSTKYISPYSTQYLQLGFFKKDAESPANCFLNIMIGIELFSDYLLSPYVEGGYVLGVDHFAIRSGGGLRFSF